VKYYLNRAWHFYLILYTYKNFLLGASIKYFLGQNVSLSKLESRVKPFAANLMAGWFFNIGLFKSRDMFKSDFAKQMKKFYYSIKMVYKQHRLGV